MTVISQRGVVLACIAAVTVPACDGGATAGGRAGGEGDGRVSVRDTTARAVNRVGHGRYGIQVEVDRKAYGPGDTIRMHLTAYNRTGQPLLLHFNTAQRFDFVLRRGEDGLRSEPVWRWSRDRFFTQAAGTERLTEEGGEMAFTARHPAPGEPGIYLVEGKITSANWPLSATVPVTVAP